MMVPETFLLAIARNHGVSDSELAVLFPVLEGQTASQVAEGSSIRPEAARKRLGEVYKKFKIPGAGPGKLAKLQRILVDAFRAQDPSAEQVPASTSPKNPAALGTVPPNIDQFQDFRLSTTSFDDCLTSALSLILGARGAGKTVIAAQVFTDQGHLARKFNIRLWRSLSRGTRLLSELVHSLTGKSSPATSAQRIDILMEQLRKESCLLVLDGWDALFQEGAIAGSYQPWAEGELGDFLHRVATESHKSSVIVTSTEPPQGLSHVPGVYQHQVPPWAQTAVAELLRDVGAEGKEEEAQEIARYYRGNPLMIRMVGRAIAEVFGGSVSHFLAQPSRLIGGVRELMVSSIERVSTEEKKALEMMVAQKMPVPIGRIDLGELGVEVLQSLVRRSLIEPTRSSSGEPCFNMPRIVQDAVVLGSPALKAECNSARLLIKSHRADQKDLEASDVLS